VKWVVWLGQSEGIRSLWQGNSMNCGRLKIWTVRTVLLSEVPEGEKRALQEFDATGIFRPLF
jgi:hypothetical protein